MSDLTEDRAGVMTAHPSLSDESRYV